MKKIYCPYVKGRKFVNLEAAFHCSDCRWGCPLVENILNPAIEDIIRMIDALDGDSE